MAGDNDSPADGDGQVVEGTVEEGTVEASDAQLQQDRMREGTESAAMEGAGVAAFVQVPDDPWLAAWRMLPFAVRRTAGRIAQQPCAPSYRMTAKLENLITISEKLGYLR